MQTAEDAWQTAEDAWLPRSALHVHEQMRTPGVEPGSQAWEACMMPLHYVRHCTQAPPARIHAHAARLIIPGMRAFLGIVWIVGRWFFCAPY